MGGRTSNLGQMRVGTNIFLVDLSALRFDSITTCFSKEDQVCVPIGLGALSALLSLYSCFLLMYQRCKKRGENTGEDAASHLYCFIGNLCSTFGAILSKQLAIQVVMGVFMAAVDVVNFISIFPMFLCWKSERRLRRRRRQHLLAVCVLLVLGGGYLNSRVSHSPADRPFIGRKLLHVLHQDNTEILGYILGLLSFVIACTSKFPAISRARRGQMATKAHVISGVLCSLAGALYISAMLLYDTRFEFVLRAMPWLLSATCCAILELLILTLHCCRSGARQQSDSEGCSPDTESLLEGTSNPVQNSPPMKRDRKQQRNVKEMTEMGRYMDVNVQPAEKVCLKEMTLSGEEVLENHPPKGTVRVVRVDWPCSLDSSYDSSSVSSDLEWDFEEANAKWSETPAKQKRVDEFPLKEWVKNPQPLGICTCDMSGLVEKTASGKEVAASGTTASIHR